MLSEAKHLCIDFKCVLRFFTKLASLTFSRFSKKVNFLQLIENVQNDN